MSSSFPGMNPYLEYPAFWSSFHTRLIVAIAEAIEPQLERQYYVEVESRTLEIKERYLEVREMVTDQVITVIELLSLKNKCKGEGRTAYEKKRRLILGSSVHLVELDLLQEPYDPSTYRILVSRSQQRPTADLYGITIRNPLPSFPIPLKPDDPDAIVALQDVFNHVYDRGRYESRIDYHQPIPPPKLTDEDAAWVEQRLAAFQNL
jgi:Protein of unknown function (DUF4058)